MLKNSALEYNQLIINANGLGRSMKLLEKATAGMSDPPFIDDFFEGFAATGETLWAIAKVLTILGETPNAYINQEAMEELESHVHVAAGIVGEDWAKEILKPDSLLAL